MNASETSLLIPKDDFPSIRKFFFNILKRTLPTALSYDFSISLPVLGILMTHLGEGEAAPATTSLLALVGILVFASMLPSSFSLAADFAKLSDKEQLTDEEIKNIESRIAKTPRNAILASVLYLPTILPLIFSGKLLALLKQEKNVIEDAQSFFNVYTPFFSLFMPIRLSIEFVLLASQKQISAMLLADSSMLGAIGLEYALGFQTPLRLQGLALGAGLGTAVTSILFLIYSAKHFKNMRFFKEILSWNENDWPQIRTFIKTVLPIYISVASDFAVSFVVSILAGLLSSSALKNQNIATQYLNINMLITAANSQITGLIVAEENSKKPNITRASTASLKRAVIAGVLANMTLQLPGTIFVSAAPEIFSSIIGAAISNPEEIRFLMMATAAYSMIDGVRYNLLQSSRALGDNLIASILSSVCLWIGVIAAYLLSQYTELGVTGLPIGLLMGASAGDLVLILRLQKYFRNIENAMVLEAPSIIVEALDSSNVTRSSSPFWSLDNSNSPQESPAPLSSLTYS